MAELVDVAKLARESPLYTLPPRPLSKRGTAPQKRPNRNAASFKHERKMQDTSMATFRYQLPIQLFGNWSILIVSRSPSLISTQERSLLPSPIPLAPDPTPGFPNLERPFTPPPPLPSLHHQAKIMAKATETGNVVGCTANEMLRTSLPVMYTELEKCQKSLEGYLEQKRNKFPRFYFVSNPGESPRRPFFRLPGCGSPAVVRRRRALEFPVIAHTGGSPAFDEHGDSPSRHRTTTRGFDGYLLARSIFPSPQNL